MLFGTSIYENSVHTSKSFDFCSVEVARRGHMTLSRVSQSEMIWRKNAGTSICSNWMIL